MKRRFEVFGAVLAASMLIAGVAAAASSPAVVTAGTSGVTQTSSVLHGTVDPNGSSTTYYFQWGLTNGYGVNGKARSAGHGTKPVSVHETAGGLIPGTTYHYRLVATNGGGTTVGADRTFRTAGHPPPGVTTGPASDLSATSATLTGVLSPNGESTSWAFQYGLTPSYGAQTFGGTVAATSPPVNVSWALAGLAPGTVFHYRLIATHGTAASYSYGVDASFMTYPSRRPFARLRAAMKPRVARHRPYVIAITGTVVPASSIPAAYGCSGDVMMRFLNGRRRAATTFAGVQPNCTFGGVTVFKRLPRHPKGRRTVALKVLVTFLGNHYLAPPKALTKHLVLG